MIRRVLGTMTGTSCDGLDLALLEIQGDGVELKAQFLKGSSHDLNELGPRLRALAEGHPSTMEALCQLNHDFSSFHVECIQEANFDSLDLIALHGQTLHHAPPLSLQLIDLSLVAGQMYTPVIGDLRGVDLARNGQGAPITPLADHFFYGMEGERRVVANLGGFCNLTLLPGDGQYQDICGFDVCTTNLLLDFLSRKVLDQPFDLDGEGSKQGKVIPSLRVDLEDRLRLQFQQKKSLGQNHFPSEAWLGHHPSTTDLLTTACMAIGTVIGEAIAKLKPNRLLVGGGGAKNPVLLKNIEKVAGLKAETCDLHGPPSEFREAAAIALLGALAQDRVPITLPKVTGAQGSFVSGLFIDPRHP